MSLREDWGPADSAELWPHFNYFSAGVNKIGETFRLQLPGGVTGTMPMTSSENYTFGLVEVDTPYASTMSTMTTKPVRLPTGRRWTPEPGPYRVVWQGNWDAANKDGHVQVGIWLDMPDRGADFGPGWGGELVAEQARGIRDGHLYGGPEGWGSTARCEVELDLPAGSSLTFACRQYSADGAQLGIRRRPLWTYVMMTRIGH